MVGHIGELPLPLRPLAQKVEALLKEQRNIRFEELQELQQLLPSDVKVPEVTPHGANIELKKLLNYGPIPCKSCKQK